MPSWSARTAPSRCVAGRGESARCRIGRDGFSARRRGTPPNQAQPARSAQASDLHRDEVEALVITQLLLTSALLGGAGGQQGLADFAARIQNYLDVRRVAAQTVPPLAVTGDRAATI